MPPPQKSDCLPISCIEKRRNRPLGPLSRFFGGLILFIGLSAWTLPIKPELTPNSGEKGLLFEISGKGIKKPSYIFALNYWLSEEYIIKNARNLLPYVVKADGFSTETPLDRERSIAGYLKIISLKADTPVFKMLSEGDIKKVKKAFKSANYDFDSIADVHPAVLVSLLSASLPHPKSWRDGADKDHAPMEYALYALAEDQKVPYFPLEKTSDGMKTLISVGSEEYFAKALMDVVNNPKRFLIEMDSIRTAYVAQDLELTAAIIERYERLSKAQNQELARRYQGRILPVMEKHIKVGNHFFTIGAGRLGGSYGVLAALKKKGYKIKALPLQ